MHITLSELIYLFALTSFLGWFIEFIYRSLKAKKIVNPGFLRGPYLPIYGTGALLIIFCRDQLQESHFLMTVFAYFSAISGFELISVGEKYLQIGNFIVKCFTYFSVMTGLEFVTGFVFEGCLHTRLWDYTKQPFCIKNYVCLPFSICWLIMSLCFEYLFLPFLLSFIHQVNPIAPFVFTFIILEVMFIDMILRLVQLSALEQINKEGMTANEDLLKFANLIKPIVEHPSVAKLADFKHHRDTTRLEHSIEVAWLSYILAKRMYLDYEATVRGALLHDLFFYDWLYEGPRLHGFRHPKISLKNAREVTDLSKKEEDIIMKHMWPLTAVPPLYMESWIVCFVDTYCTIKEYVVLLKNVYEE